MYLFTTLYSYSACCIILFTPKEKYFNVYNIYTYIHVCIYICMSSHSFYIVTSYILLSTLCYLPLPGLHFSPDTKYSSNFPDWTLLISFIVLGTISLIILRTSPKRPKITKFWKLGLCAPRSHIQWSSYSLPSLLPRTENHPQQYLPFQHSVGFESSWQVSWHPWCAWHSG